MDTRLIYKDTVFWSRAYHYTESRLQPASRVEINVGPIGEDVLSQIQIPNAVLTTTNTPTGR